MAKFLFQITDEDLRSIIREEFIASRKIEEVNDSPKQQKLKLFLTRKETANLLRVSLVSLRKYHRLGLLVPLKIGGRVLYEYNIVIAAINDGRLNKANKTYC